ncbi:50S ribosomal protein L5 [Mycoplasma sp. T363T]|uniref:Large ribosomal subunit protein uL5 n=2 Tax=Mycoplasma bradburyae TaxID=2963128 RepID=A0ABT5GBL2_9MOLU|nr:50S ribosomal protein L5 [Mycoplasma bradburyae]MDC4163277.1 50S ribosomal protein L5 [Mycoplasma bradburyae]MDC4181891.1 50S ribosomal protein L5 [Mycoplasma bradburyae]MDC4182590.1 50S ribosomal protein L5 [Mycoplasma bradburyae]MDC4184074.1 50S ribosomal protein L5 [Mycoplasma bradburyae]UTS70190.1 50S ribosomal protein L5 [Mycoplasma bradburyae]
MNLKTKYKKEIVPLLQKEFGLSSVMQVPKIEKIVINMGVGDATKDAKLLELAQSELQAISGQKPIVTKAHSSNASFKIRQGQAIGCKVTLRGERMWNFLEKLINIALPRVRDFRGLSNKAFDSQGNYTLGIKEQIIFPEIIYDNVKKIRGFDVTLVISTNDSKQNYRLLLELGMPLIKNKEQANG